MVLILQLFSALWRHCSKNHLQIPNAENFHLLAHVVQNAICNLLITLQKMTTSPLTQCQINHYGLHPRNQADKREEYLSISLAGPNTDPSSYQPHWSRSGWLLAFYWATPLSKSLPPMLQWESLGAVFNPNSMRCYYPDNLNWALGINHCTLSIRVAHSNALRAAPGFDQSYEGPLWAISLIRYKQSAPPCEIFAGQYFSHLLSTLDGNWWEALSPHFFNLGSIFGFSMKTRRLWFGIDVLSLLIQILSSPLTLPPLSLSSSLQPSLNRPHKSNQPRQR